MVVVQSGVAFFHAHLNAMRVAIRIEPAPIIDASRVTTNVSPSHSTEYPYHLGIRSTVFATSGKFAPVVPISRQNRLVLEELHRSEGACTNFMCLIS